MSRAFFLEMAARRIRFPLGTDLVLHEEADPAEIVRDGRRLGRVIERAAARWGIPIAMPLMDLEHSADGSSAEYHALVGATDHIAAETALLPCAMVIGPFSLATKLAAEPITAVALAGRGVSADEEPLVQGIEAALAEAEVRVARAIGDHLAAGARALVMCEPAASIAYFSPRQLRAGADIFRHYVLEPNLRLKRLLDAAEADLIFHDCGELTAQMVRAFGAEIHPVMLSLGSSRTLWEDAALVPPDVVLYGNLPTKTFYCDDAMPDETVRGRTAELLSQMERCGRAFILGSECDVLDVAAYRETIRRKVELMMATPAKPETVEASAPLFR
jgi:hypothetical protein